MVQPDPSLGFNVDFDADGFRSAVRFAMEMGTPPDPDKRPKFVIKSSAEPTYWKNSVQLTDPPRLDPDGKPYDAEVEVRRANDNVLTDVDCAVEVTRADAEELPIGNFRPTKVVITVLDEEYARIRNARELIYNGDRYLFGYEPEAFGMFTVGVHTMIFYAVDET